MTFDIVSSQIVDEYTNIVIENTLHLKIGDSVTVDSTQAIIVNINAPFTISVSGEFDSPKKVTYPRPFFFVGTPLAVIANLDARKKTRDKYPIIYLFEIISENHSGFRGDRIERTADIILCFLDQSSEKYSNSLNQDDYFDKIVDGQYRLAEYFVNSANNSATFARLDDGYKIIPYPIWGKFDGQNGVKSSIFNDKLSGVELRLILPVLKESECLTFNEI
jgi:hypothetical protein